MPVLERGPPGDPRGIYRCVTFPTNIDLDAEGNPLSRQSDQHLQLPGACGLKIY